MTRPANDVGELTSRILALFPTIAECPLPPDQLVAALTRLRESDGESFALIARMLMDIIERQGAALTSVEEAQEELRELVRKLTASPYFPAVFLGATHSGAVQGALVQTDTERRVVEVSDEVPLDQLIPGDEVFLSHERNFLIGKSAGESCRTGEVGSYSRSIADGRLVLRARDEEVVVLPAAGLRGLALKAGEGVRFDRVRGLALERIEASQGAEYFLEATPKDSFDEIGGLDREIEALKRVLSLNMFHAETVRKYKLRPKRAVLMEGPPGNGKTKTARAACAWLASLSKSGRSRFINVKPGALNSMWYGQTEERYREIFRVAREAALADPELPIVMFWDEVDAVSATRGESLHRIDDRILNTFAAELDGLEERGNIVILSATNRRDALDPAIARPGRLGDMVIHFPQPNRQAARAILGCHLPAGIPFAANGEGMAAAREALLDLAVGQIFAPRRDTELASLTLRDGKQRLVCAADLVSGSQLEAIARAAIERACLREAEGGPAGVAPADLSAAISDFFQMAPRGLTPRNARNYLPDIPQDVDVTRVDVIEHKVSHPHRYRMEVA